MFFISVKRKSLLSLGAFLSQHPFNTLNKTAADPTIIFNATILQYLQ